MGASPSYQEKVKKEHADVIILPLWGAMTAKQNEVISELLRDFVNVINWAKFWSVEGTVLAQSTHLYFEECAVETTKTMDVDIPLESSWVP